MESEHAASLPNSLQPFSGTINELQRVGELSWQRGWNRCISGSYSVIVNHNPKKLLISSGGKNSGLSQRTDLALVDAEGRPIDPDQPVQTADGILHCLVAEDDAVGAVLHTQSIWTTILSMRFLSLKGILLEGFELLRGLSGVTTQEHAEWLPIIENCSETATLKASIRTTIEQSEQPLHGFLIHQNGLYTWGRDLEEAVRHAEILEFLCEVLGRQARM